MKYLWTEDTGAGLHFWKLVNQLFFDDALVVESKMCIRDSNEHGIVRSGPQVMLGANDSYVALCRRHFKLGMLGPDAEAKEQCAE